MEPVLREAGLERFENLDADGDDNLLSLPCDIPHPNIRLLVEVHLFACFAR